jgi:hypothetical protein
LLISLLAWDQRSERDLYMERFADGPPVFQDLIPVASTVYWEDDVKAVWIMLRRASFVSYWQGTGAMFYRQTALSWRERLQAIGPLQTQDQVDHFASKRRTWPPRARPAARALSQVCERAAGLDFLVLETGIPDLYVARWRAPYTQTRVDQASFRPQTSDRPVYYLYDCKRLRREARSPASRRRQRPPAGTS